MRRTAIGAVVFYSCLLVSSAIPAESGVPDSGFLIGPGAGKAVISITLPTPLIELTARRLALEIRNAQGLFDDLVVRAIE